MQRSKSAINILRLAQDPLILPKSNGTSLKDHNGLNIHRSLRSGGYHILAIQRKIRGIPNVTNNIHPGTNAKLLSRHRFENGFDIYRDNSGTGFTARVVMLQSEMGGGDIIGSDTI